ncbi:MAG: hypothetical protein ACREQ9_03535 [Candidatus Binatia bacterium]
MGRAVAHVAVLRQRDLDGENRVYNVVNSFIPTAVLDALEAPKAKQLLDRDAAVAKAIAALRVRRAKLRGKISAELVMFPVGKSTRPAWKLIIPSSDPPRSS